VNNYELAKDPNKIRPSEIDVSKMRLAGRLSDIGQQILNLNGKKASHIVTLDWGVGKYDSSL
jgi:hypothetical protein